MARVVQCIGPSYQLADRKSAVQRAVNLHLREIEAQGEDKTAVLDSVDGLEAFIAAGADFRCIWTTDTRWFAVAGSTLYEVSGSSLVSRGTLATSSGAVDMQHGRDQLVVVDGANGYVLNLNTNAFAQITSTAWRGSWDVNEIDGYFIFTDPDTDQFYISAIDDGSTMDALDFSSADTSPDNIVTSRVLKRQLVLFGTESTELWVDSGDADFPFVRYGSAPIDVGIVGRRAAINAADTLFFVGQTKAGRGIVYVMAGNQPLRVSNRAVEEDLQKADLSECSMWTYMKNGAEFVGINAPGMSKTWVFDAAIKQWHERCDLVAGEYTAHRIDQVVRFGGEHYASAGAKLLRVTPDVYTFDGDVMVRERTWPHLVNAAMEPVSYAGLELACTTGHGGVVTLEISNNGGITFGTPLLRSLGEIGRWMQRVRWLGLGSAVDRVFRLRVTDPVPFKIHGATVATS